MKFTQRQRSAAPAPGLIGTARVDRSTRVLLPRLGPGSIAVVDHLDMDRATAQALVDAGVAAVVNASPFISGRYPNLGPEILIGAGVTLVEVDPEAHARIRDNSSLRVHDGGLYDGSELLAQGRELDGALVAERMASSRDGLASQLTSFTHNSTEFLRREEALLLHGLGMPRLSTAMEGRPVVVVVKGHESEAELAGIRRYLREIDPVLVGVDQGADLLRDAGHRADVVVLTADAGGPDGWPSAKALRSAHDVLVRAEPGTERTALEHVGRLVQRPLYLETSATSEDAALLLADLSGARTIIGVGMHATLDEFLDRQRHGLASTYLTRLKVGPKLVDAAAVPELYSGRVRAWHVLLVLLASVAALLAAIGVTPMGQIWADAVGDRIANLYDYLQGLLS